MPLHTLVNTGMRWHVRVCSGLLREEPQARDFVLSRFSGEPDLLDKTEHGITLDEVWNTEVSGITQPDLRLDAAQKAIIQTDFGMVGGQLEIPSRRALVK